MIYFAEEGQSKRSVVWFDDHVIDIPFDEESGRPTTAWLHPGEYA